MKATTIAQAQPPGIAADTTVKDAIPFMEKHTGCAVGIIEGTKLVGTLTKNDVLRRVVAAGLDAATTRVSDVMTSPPITAPADIDTDEALKLMSEHRVCYLPLVEAGGKMVAWLAICHLYEDHVEMLSDQLDTLANYVGADGPGG